MKKDIAVLIIITVCFTVCFSVLASLTGIADSLLPEAVELHRLQDSEGISFEDLTALNQRLGRQNISLSGESSGAAVKGAANVKVVLVNENFFDCYGMQPSAGSLFDAAVIESCDPLVIISERTAMDLFFTTNVLGNEIQIDGEPFIIAGLYDSEKGFWEEAAKDTSERVYIPYTSFYDGEQELVDVITYEENQYTADYHNNLRAYFGSSFNGYDKIDYALGKTMATQFYLIFHWGVVFVLCCYLLAFTYRNVRKIWMDAKTVHKETYFLSFLKETLKRNYLAIIAAAVELASVIILLSITRLEVTLPTAMIPTENVFDIKYYLDSFLQYAQSNNAAYYTADGFYKKLLENTIIACAALLPICALLLSGLVRRAAALGRKNKWRLTEYLIWLLLIGIILLGICFLAGYPNVSQAGITFLSLAILVAAAGLFAISKGKVR